MKSAFNIDPSITSAFSLNELKESDSEFILPAGFSASVIGGGSGSPVSIKTLLSLGVNTSAIVAMADDGGSTGKLREAADVTAPGDIRKCICAFASDPTDPLTRAFKYRFPLINNHTLGNLMLSALEDASGSFYEAIQICEKLLNCKGHVFPSTLDHVTLSATTCDSKQLDGQALACASNTALFEVKLNTDKQGAMEAFRPAIEAILSSDLIVLGPGSLFTSIIPNLLVPGINDAIKKSGASVLFVCGLSDTQGETWGLSALEHVLALNRHGMDGVLTYVLINDSRAEPSEKSETQSSRLVKVSDEDIKSIQDLGVVPVLRDLTLEGKPGWHNPKALKEALVDVIKLMGS